MPWLTCIPPPPQLTAVALVKVTNTRGGGGGLCLPVHLFPCSHSYRSHPFSPTGYCWPFSSLTSMVYRPSYCLSTYSLSLPFVESPSTSLANSPSGSAFLAGYSMLTPWAIAPTPRISIVIPMLLIANLQLWSGSLSWVPGPNLQWTCGHSAWISNTEIIPFITSRPGFLP